jgi:hypothetical protein
MKLVGIFVCSIFLFGSLPAARVHAQVSTTFDSDLEGWQVIGGNDAAWEEATGNPGGCLSVNDAATGDMDYLIAPPAYHGDWSNMTGLDSLSVEIFHSASDPDDFPPDYIFRIAGPGGSAHALSGLEYLPVQDIWNRFVVSLDPADWTIESGNWTEILSFVNSLRICGEFTSGLEICREDNINLSSTPVPVFNPCAYDDFNTPGTGDWTFSETGNVSNPGEYGNGGGYVRVADSSGLSRALAPTKFLGDWSGLAVNGYLSIDLRVISRTTQDLGVSEFIRISGPGGTAHVDLDPADLPEGSLIWKTFSYLINPGIWTLDAGTWYDLIANVTECSITVEFFDGSESIGFDNFGRFAQGCAPIDSPLQIHDPNTRSCGYRSFVTIASVALNPLDGELYGLVTATTGSGGGIYPLTGAGAGIRIQAYDRPAHLIFDTDGDAYISENYAGEVYRLEWLGSSSLWVSGFHDGDDDPYGMTFAPAGFNSPNVNPGDILIVDHGASTDATDCVYSFSPDVAEGEQLVLPDTGDYDFYDIAAGANNIVYICDALNTNSLFTLDAFGNLTPITLNTTETLTILSVVYDHVDDDLYIACASNLAVYRLEPSTGEVVIIADGFSSFEECCLEIDTTGRRLWIADNGYGRIYELCLGEITAIDDQTPRNTDNLSLKVFPNPFNPLTSIYFVLDRASNTRLDIFDVSGQRIRTLIDTWLEVGTHQVQWDGLDSNQEPSASGVYFIRIEAGDRTEKMKMVLVR